MIQNLDSIVRKLGGILLNHAREKLGAGRRHARNRNIAAQRLAGLPDFDECRRQLGQQATRLRQEVSSKRSDRDGARGPLQELYSKERFDVLYPPRKRCLGDMKRRRRFLEGPLVGNGDECLHAQRIDLHQLFASIS